jgi:hypothetical protein
MKTDDFNGKEKREYPRIKKNLPLKISREDEDIITETRNISCSGVYCRISAPVPMMSKIKMTLLLPLENQGKVKTHKIECRGIVVRSEPVRDLDGRRNDSRHNIAVFFTDLTKPQRTKIAQYVIQSFRSIS